jgi:hypothetical protein
MVQVFTLEINLRTAVFLRPTLGVVNRAWATDKML